VSKTVRNVMRKSNRFPLFILALKMKIMRMCVIAPNDPKNMI